MPEETNRATSCEHCLNGAQQPGVNTPEVASASAARLPSCDESEEGPSRGSPRGNQAGYR
jgi:hypothetical protein